MNKRTGKCSGVGRPKGDGIVSENQKQTVQRDSHQRNNLACTIALAYVTASVLNNLI